MAVKAAAKESAKSAARLGLRRAWWHRLTLVGLGLATLVAAVVFGASSVQTWMDQNAQLEEAEEAAAELNGQILELNDDIARRTTSDGVRREALCYGPYVAPGTEVYAVMGLRGCVSPPQDRP